MQTSLGNRVYDLSDSKYDEEISKDPESWVMKILMKPNIRILVLDSPVARFALALASSSTATTSLVSSTTFVNRVEHNNDDVMNIVEEVKFIIFYINKLMKIIKYQFYFI